MNKQHLAVIIAASVIFSFAATSITYAAVTKTTTTKTAVTNSKATTTKTPAKATTKTATKATPAKTAVVKTNVLTEAEAIKAAEKFISVNFLNGSTKIKTKITRHANGLYYMDFTLDGSSEVINSAFSDDGKYFFTQVIDVKKLEADKKKAEAEAAKAEQARLASVAKTTKPVVELFVMSHCPYGTQIEKGIIPVVETLGDNIDFKLKFVDYSMHGEKELAEQVNQYCLNKNEPTKLIPYLKCFLKDGDGETCLKTVSADTAKLATCQQTVESTYKIMANFADKTTWSNDSFPSFPIYKADNDKYGVPGSPTLVIDGQNVNTGRSSAELLRTICSHFVNQPKACATNLSATSPSAGFGYETTNTASPAASCGN